MNIDNLISGIATPRIPDPSAPRRELDIRDEDEQIIDSAIEELDRSSLETEHLYEVFRDWQTKKTLTSKRIFVSTSILVAAAAWIGVEHTELVFFGLKVANGSPDKLITFVLCAILASGVFYELSRRIDASVRNAKINHINRDLKYLVRPIEAIDQAMERNEVKSFSDLYFDFRSPLSAGRHDAIDVYRAIKFYKDNLSKAGMGLALVTVTEQIIIYATAALALFLLAGQLVK